MSSKKNVLLTVNGLEIRDNSVYKIVNKPDEEAPDGFQRAGTTKLPSVGIANTVPCRFVVSNVSTGEGVYDTGFYQESPCYADKSPTEVKSTVALLKKYIVTPYESKRGTKGLLDNSNTKFWDSFGVRLEEGRVFNTNNPDDLLDLYIAMQGYELTPKEEVGNPKFNESQFCIEDKEASRDIETERDLEMMDAISSLNGLLKANKTKLANIFKYIGILTVNEEVDAPTMKVLGFQWFNRHTSNPNKFLSVLEMTETEGTEDVVDMFV